MTPVVAMVGIFGPATIVVLLFVVQSLVLVEKMTKDICVLKWVAMIVSGAFCCLFVVIVDFSLPYWVYFGVLICYS